MPSSYNHFSLIVSSTINLIAMLFLCVLVSGCLKLVVTSQFYIFFFTLFAQVWTIRWSPEEDHWPSVCHPFISTLTPKNSQLAKRKSAVRKGKKLIELINIVLAWFIAPCLWPPDAQTSIEMSRTVCVAIKSVAPILLTQQQRMLEVLANHLFSHESCIQNTGTRLKSIISLNSSLRSDCF